MWPSSERGTETGEEAANIDEMGDGGAVDSSLCSSQVHSLPVGSCYRSRVLVSLNKIPCDQSGPVGEGSEALCVYTQSHNRI